MKNRNTEIISSPMNYTGGKAKLLPQLLPLFPKEIDVFYDAFTGGGNVAINVLANKIKANDLNNFVIKLLEVFQKTETEKLLTEIDNIINNYNLSKTTEGKDGFLKLRKEFNLIVTNKNQILNEEDLLKLYMLICHSFNYQIRFNNKHEFNNPFGLNKSCFSSKLREKLILFSNKLKTKNYSDFEFSISDFETFINKYINNMTENDFVYFDPPYLITTGSYNDGNRGFKDWTEEQEVKLYNILKQLNNKGIKFGLSNVLEHKGKINDLLKNFVSENNLKVHYLNYSYSDFAYSQTKNSDNKKNLKNHKTIEAFITNY